MMQLDVSRDFGGSLERAAQAVRGRVETIHVQAEKAAQAVVETTASGKVLDNLAAQLKASLGQFKA
jgi:hypothetical protein